MSAAAQDTRLLSPGRARLETAALCVGNAVGFSGSSAIPLWVAAMIKIGRLSTVQVGWLASGELFCLAASVLAISVWAKAAQPRRVAVAAAAAIVTFNAIAMLPALGALVAGRLLSGLAMGALLSSVTRLAARRPDAQRVLALMQAAMVLQVSVLFFVSPTLIGRFGPAGLFAILAAAGAVALATLSVLPDDNAGAGAARTARGRWLAPLVACLALALVFTGQNCVWTYIVLIGNALGIDSHMLGSVLAIVPPLAMLGPLAAHALGERAGLLGPLLLGSALLAFDAFLLVAARSPVQFCIYAALLNVLILFCVPYAITFVSRLDASGRFASAAPAFMMIGGAISPTLGGTVLEMRGFATLPYVTASCIALSIVLFSSAAGMISPLKAKL